MYSFGTHSLSHKTCFLHIFGQAMAMLIPHPHISQWPVLSQPYHVCPPAPPLIHIFTTFLQVLTPPCLADSTSLLVGSRLPPPSHLPHAWQRGFLKHRSDDAQGWWTPSRAPCGRKLKLQGFTHKALAGLAPHHSPRVGSHTKLARSETLTTSCGFTSLSSLMLSLTVLHSLKSRDYAWLNLVFLIPGT